jgi:hypothetical protein
MNTMSFNSLKLAGAIAAMGLAGCAATAQDAQPSAPPSAQPSAPPAMFLTAAPAPEEEAKPDLRSLCEADQKTLFSGTVEDDFGLDVSICMTPDKQAEPGQEDPVISAVWSGEGGTARVSCKASECDGVIDYTRYTRPRFTEHSVSWDMSGQSHKIIETHSAEDTSKDPEVTATYVWESDAMKATGEEPLRDPITVRTEPLAMLELSAVLGK